MTVGKIPVHHGPGDSSAYGSLPFDASVAHQARMYDYLLGGKDNYAADREAMEAVLEVHPEAAFTARANRAFLGRAVRYLAGEAGMRQFLDIGTGIPTAGNAHEVAQAIEPEARVVYVDYDRPATSSTPLERVIHESSPGYAGVAGSHRTTVASAGHPGGPGRDLGLPAAAGFRMPGESGFRVLGHGAILG